MGMEFDSQIASLQGVFVTYPPDMNQVFKILTDSQANRRKLFLCIFLNSHENICNDFSLEQGMTYGPFINLFQRNIEISEFNDIVKRCNLQNFYSECLSFFNISIEFLKSTTTIFTEAIDPFSKVSLGAALIRRSRISPEQPDSRTRSCLAQNILGNLHGLTIAEKMLSLLYLMKLSLTSSMEEVASKSLGLSTDDLSTYYSFDVRGQQLSTLDRTLFLDELLGQFVTLGRSMDVNSWIDLVDCDTESLFNGQSVNFWPHDETPPSNMQLIIAHFSYEVLNFLDVNENSEAVAILKSFANRFERRMNLKLEEMSIKEIMDSTKSLMANENPEMEWKVELYVQHLATMVDSPNYEAEVWEFLELHSIYLSKFADKFYQMGISAPETLPGRESLLNLLGSILAHVSPESLEKLLENQLTSKKFSDDLKTSHFTRSLSILLKKAKVSDLNTNSELRRKTFWFAIQSPLHFFQHLIDECCEDKSMIGLVLEILKMFPMLHQSISVQRPFENLWSGNATSEVIQNSNNLVDKLISYWIESEMFELLSDLADLILHNVLKNHLDGMKALPEAQVLGLLDILDRVLKPSVQKTSLVRRKVHFLELIELSGSYDGKYRTLVESKIKEILIGILSCILETDPELRKVLDDFATEADKLRLQEYKGKEFCQIGDFLEATLHCFHKDQCLRVSTSNQMDAQRFLGELVVGFSVFLPRDYHLIATCVKVQKHKHGKAVLVPPYIELMKALVIFLSVRASEAIEHLTYVTHAVAGAVMKMLDGLQEPDFDELSCLLQMAGMISDHWPSLGSLETLIAKVVQTGLSAENLSKSNQIFLVAPLSRMKNCETKTFCLSKMKLMIEEMAS